MARVQDVVCGMTVDTDIASHKSNYKDRTYYFCSPGCKTAFEGEPEKYVSNPAGGRENRND